MTFSEYMKGAYSTKIYADENRFTYTTPGLIGEIGEVFGKVAKVFRDNKFDPDALKKELGDCFWFTAVLVKEFDLPIDPFERTLNHIHGNDSEIHSVMGVRFDQKSKESLANKLTTLLSLLDDALHWSSSFYHWFCLIGLQSNNFEKLFPQSTLKSSMTENLVFIVKTLMCCCWVLDYDVQQALQDNLTNLQERKQRGTLQGSGDNR